MQLTIQLLRFFRKCIPFPSFLPLAPHSSLGESMCERAGVMDAGGREESLVSVRVQHHYHRRMLQCRRDCESKMSAIAIHRQTPHANRNTGRHGEKHRQVPAATVCSIDRLLATGTRYKAHESQTLWLQTRASPVSLSLSLLKEVRSCSGEVRDEEGERMKRCSCLVLPQRLLFLCV